MGTVAQAFAIVLCAWWVFAAAAQVRVVTVSGPINPVTADYLRRNIHEAGRQGEDLLLIELDTPGGLDSSMRAIVKEMLSSRVPVAVFVAPAGSRAASAGATIALAADVCAMAPGTNIGAAHPVTIGEKPDETMRVKLVNDAAAYAEGIALKRGRDPALAQRIVRESLSLSAADLHPSSSRYCLVWTRLPGLTQANRPSLRLQVSAIVWRLESL